MTTQQQAKSGPVRSKPTHNGSAMTPEVRIGKALAVLWTQFRAWEMFTKSAKSQLVARWHIASKTQALIKHDRILRGEA